ncbi:Ribose import permease protein RbsC [Leucobacter soli]|uniref:Autoinducer 2 import system permease protein LsrD n=2 Tax=Leucobacter soli TaxID=2812850 RepID=A0A916JZR5_9MICO|nr:Ribose import permease protein RbsC [Leucobacter soli]
MVVKNSDNGGISVRVEHPPTDTISIPLQTRPRGGALVLDLLREYGIVAATVVLFVVMAFASDAFLTPGNLLNILSQNAAVGIIACAMTLTLIAGGFDLSLGAIFGVATISTSLVMNATGSIALGVLTGLGVGFLAGLLNGAIVTYGRINFFVATLAMSLIYRGLAYVITGGFIVVVTAQAFSSLSRAPLFLGVRAPVIIFIVFALVCGFILKFTVFGRHIFAVGSNDYAARLSGVNVSMVRTWTYVIGGVAAAMAGLITMSRTLSVDAQAGLGIEFDAIAAVLVGGTSLMGGSGAIWRTVVGVMLFALINNGFNLLGLDPLYNKIFVGAVIILAVALDVWGRKRSSAA